MGDGQGLVRGEAVGVQGEGEEGEEEVGGWVGGGGGGEVGLEAEGGGEVGE